MQVTHALQILWRSKERVSVEQAHGAPVAALATQHHDIILDTSSALSTTDRGLEVLRRLRQSAAEACAACHKGVISIPVCASRNRSARDCAWRASELAPASPGRRRRRTATGIMNKSRNAARFASSSSASRNLHNSFRISRATRFRSSAGRSVQSSGARNSFIRISRMDGRGRRDKFPIGSATEAAAGASVGVATAAGSPVEPISGRQREGAPPARRPHGVMVAQSCGG
jgi:hypothetical protein